MGIDTTSHVLSELKPASKLFRRDKCRISGVLTDATPLTSTIMVLFFSSAGGFYSNVRAFAFLTLLPSFPVVHNPAVVIYAGKDKHESECCYSPPDFIV